MTTYFTGASGTTFRSGSVAGTGGAPFSTPGRTNAQQPTSPPPSGEPAGPHGVLEWLQSEQARHYEGKWVLLDDDRDVVDSDDSPGRLLERHPQEASPLVVLVERSDIQLAV